MSGRRLVRPLVLICVLLLVVLAALWAYQVAQHGLAAYRIVTARLAWAQQIGKGGGLPSAADLDSAKSDLDALNQHLTSLRRDVGPLPSILDRTGWIPVIGADLQAAPHLLEMGIELTGVAQAGFPIARALLDRPATGSANEPALSESLLAALRDAGPALDAARAHGERALAARAGIKGKSFASPLGKYLAKLDPYLPLLGLSLRVAPAVPALLGDDRPRTYLLLAQNSDEMRPTGGFISSVGTVTVTKGQISGLNMRDSYLVDDLNVDHPLPPEPLIRHMNIGVLLMRDVNWWPDFPTTAAAAMRMWESDQRQTVDGVIAVDQEAMRLLLEGVGPLVVEGETKPVDAAGLTDLLRQRWGVVPDDVNDKYQWWLTHKDIVSTLAKAAIERVQGGLGAQDMLRLARSLNAAVDGKHLLVYSRDPALRPVLADAGVDGAILPTRGDYLMVVDTNMGFNKVNPYIEQQLAYTVDLGTDGRAAARISAVYTNTAAVRLAECVHGPIYGKTYEDMMQRCYWDYVRVYSPLGSTALLGAESPDWQTGSDGDKTTFATLVVVAPGDAHDVTLDYLLPTGVVTPQGHESTYRLLLQKQAGTAPMSLSVTLALPSGAKLSSATPQPSMVNGNRIVFDLLLDREQRLEVSYGR